MFHPSERWFTRTLARKHRDCSLKANRRRPILESLEDRVVLSMVDLTTALSSGTINGAIYRQGDTQPAGSGVIKSFVQLQNNGTEQGYNTDAGASSADPAQVGTAPGKNFNHALLLNQVPLISINGQAYLDFVLDINQSNSLPFLSLDEVQLSLSTSNMLGSTSSSYYTTNGTYGGNATLVYDQNPGGGGSNWVALNARLGEGEGKADMYLDVPLSDLPASAFSSGIQGQLPLNPNDYIYLYSHFGGQGTSGPGNNAQSGPVDYTTNDGFKQWASPTLGANVSTTTTTIYSGATGTTPLPSPVPAFSTVHDGATVTGSNGTPTGTVTFLFYTTIDGTGTPAGAGTVTLDANGVANPSDAEGPLNPGNYSFKAVYNGDSTYLPSVSPVEPLTISKATPSVDTTIVNANGSTLTQPTPLGTSVEDTASFDSLVSGFTPTGTVTYTFTGSELQFLTAPSSWTVTGSGATTTWSDTVTVASDGTIPPSDATGPLAAGTDYSFSAKYTPAAGETNYLTATSAAEPLTISKADTSTATVIKDATTNETPTGVLGESVYDTATVTGTPSFTPTGTVTYNFYNTAAPVLGTTTPVTTETVTMTGGTVPNSSATAALAAGSYSYIAVYSGDSNYNGSSSDVEPLTVPAAAPPLITTTIHAVDGAAVSGPVPLGTSVYDTATLSGFGSTAPTGTVTYTFVDISTGALSGTETVQVGSNGSVPNSTPTPPLHAGSYTYQAQFIGNGFWNGVTATSDLETLTVNQATPSGSTTIHDSVTNLPPPAAGDPLGSKVYDTATVTGIPGFTPTGTVTYNFYNTATPVYGTTVPSTTETVTLAADGTVPNSAVTAALAVGSYSYIAVYSGDSNYAGSTGTAEPLTISEATPSVDTAILTANGSPLTQPAALGTSVEDTASFDSLVSGFTPTGTVTYTFTGSGLASLTPPGGTWTVSNSTTWTETVTVTNGSIPNSYATGPLGAGTYSFSAVYTPAATETSYLTATSAAEPLTISKATPSVDTAILTANGSPLTQPAALGTSVEDTASFDSLVSGFTPTGTVTYTFTGSGLASLTPPGGTWTVSNSTTWTETVTVTNGSIPNSYATGPLGAGTYSFSAVYTPAATETSYLTATSAAEPLTISKATPSVDTAILTANGSPLTQPAALGTSVEDTASFDSLVSGFTPTGTVTYTFTGSGLASLTPPGGTWTVSNSTTWTETVTVTNGSIPNSYATGPLGVGTYSFSAVYTPAATETNYLTATSAAEPLTISEATPSVDTAILTANGSPLTQPAALGTSVEDTASFDSLVSGFTPTGTVTYTFTGSGLASLTPPGGTWTVSNSTTWTETVTVTNGSIPNSYATGPLGAGTYSFSAVYTPAATETSYLTATSAAEPLTISKATPSVDTAILTANGSPLTQPAALGTSVEDTASFDSLVSGFTPTGTVTYTFTGSGLASLTPPGGTWTVSNSTTWTETVTVTNGSIPNSYATGPLGAGTYSFSAVYTPAATETSYLTATSAAEPLTISKATPSVDTAILTANGSPLTQPAALGTSVEDTASFDSLVSGFTPTGTVTYTFTGSGLASLTPPGGTWTVSNSTTWTETVTVTNGSIPNSYATGPLGAGTYSFSAVYSPAATETNYLTATSAAEPLTISKATPSVSTTILDSVTNGADRALGESVYDTATVTGTAGFTPTGTVTYNFYNTATPVYGTTTPVTTQTVTLTATGAVPNSADTAALAAGSYSYIAVYSGDSNYNGSTSPVEPLTVPAAAPPLITTTIHAVDGAAVSGPVPLGTSVYDTATLSGFGSTAPTGTVTYTFVDISTGALVGPRRCKSEATGRCLILPLHRRCMRAATRTRRSSLATASGTGLRPPATPRR